MIVVALSVRAVGFTRARDDCSLLNSSVRYALAVAYQ